MRFKIVLICFGTLLWCATASTGAAGIWKTNPPDAFPADVAVAWFDLLYDIVKSEQVAPPPASRSYGIAAVTLYEAIVAGSEDHMSLVGQLNGLMSIPQPIPFLSYHWPTVANSALATVVKGLFPDASQVTREAIDMLEQQFAEQFHASMRQLVFTRSVAFGQAVSETILAWAATDGIAIYNNCLYTPPIGPAFWQPTPPSYSPYPAQPCWGQLRAFVLTSGVECAPPPPPDYSEDPASEFYADAYAVYHTSLTLTEDQQIIAQYWADTPGSTGTPPGHWIAIMGQIARNDGASLMAAAEGYARVGIAVVDAFISCWYTKYTYNLLRPVTYIRNLINAAWLPYIVTPPFPEYSSGHSTQSAAAAAVLTGMFGVHAFTDTTHLDHDLDPPLEPRSFVSFEEAAKEAAVSRFYGGIHYPFGNNNGLAQGHCIGQTILNRVQFKRPQDSPIP